MEQKSQHAGSHLSSALVNMNYKVAPGTKAFQCPTLHFVAMQTSAFLNGEGSVFVSQGSRSIRTAMTDHLYGNQGTPILITSAPSPQLPWPFTVKGPGQQNPLCFHAMEAEGENGAPSSTIDAVCHLAVLLI